jgi:hypothetical protein
VLQGKEKLVDIKTEELVEDVKEERKIIILKMKTDKTIERSKLQR